MLKVEGYNYKWRIMSPTEMTIIQACREALESLETKDAGNPY